MYFTVASWNIRDQLLDEDLRRKAISLGTDIIVLLEAYPEAVHGSSELQAVFEGITALTDYDVRHVLYEDADRRVDRHGLVVLVRKAFGATIEPLNIGRNVFTIRLDDALVVGVHFDDRQDETRLVQAYRLLSRVVEEPRLVILGDFNATHSSSGLGQFMRWPLISRMIDRLPVGEPGQPQSKLARIGSLATRLRAMTSSPLMSDLREAGLVDIDSGRRKTMMLGGRLPFAQLDHVVVRGVHATDFERPRVMGSDHLPVTAAIYLT